MNYLGSVLYDPAVSVSKATTALLAMTALDTTNLRVTFTVPPSGKAKVIIMGGVLHGAATFPVIMLGVLNGATVVARVAPIVTVCGAAAATTPAALYAEFIVTGLTPGASLNWDLAYGVEQIVAATGLKYGGPNTNVTAGDAFGGISFQVWDPQPITAGAQLAVDTSGRVDVGKVTGTAQTARDLGAQLDAAISTRAAAATQVSNVDYTAARAAKLDNLDAAVTTRLASASYTAPDNTRPANFTALAITAGGAVTAGTVGDKTGYSLTAAYDAAKTAASSVDYTTARAAKLDNLDAAVSSRSTFAGGAVASVTAAVTLPAIPANWITAAGITAAALNGKGDWLLASSYTAPDNAGIATIGGRLTAQRALNLDNLDAAVSSRSTYAGGDTAGTTTLLSRLTAGRATALDNLDAAISSRLAATAYTVPDNVSITAIKAKTDQLAFTVAGLVNVNVERVRAEALTGTGTEADPWVPA